jgi:hypothetical protein
MAKPDAIQHDKDGNEIAHWRFNPPAPKQEPYGYFRYDIKLDAWVQDKESTQGVAFYTAPVHASDISQERVDETAKQRHEPRLCCQKYDTCTEPCTPRGRHLARREWVGLTDEERLEVASRKWWHWEDAFDIGGFARAIEAKLKEKNG